MAPKSADEIITGLPFSGHNGVMRKEKFVHSFKYLLVELAYRCAGDGE